MTYKGLNFQNKSDKEVIIDIDGYIGWDPYDAQENQVQTKEKMKKELKKIANLKAETIFVNINSIGGNVNHGISIHDLLSEHSAKVVTKVNGMTASIATVIAMSGDERHMSDNALFLVHNASSIGWGDKNDMKTLVNDLEKIDDRIANIYSKVTGSDKQEMINLMNEDKGRGKWLSADEANEMGFITNVFEPVKAVAYFSNDILERFQLPPVPGNSNSEDPQKSGSIASQVIDGLKDFFTNNNTNSKNMNEPNFKVLAIAAGLDTLEVANGGIFLNSEQALAVQNILDQNLVTINAYSGLEDGETVEGLKTEKTNLQKSNEDLTTENETLSKNTVPPTGTGSDGDDTPDDVSEDTEANHFFELSKIK
jgi:ATP-dependent protease ClpP protease subunit